MYSYAGGKGSNPHPRLPPLPGKIVIVNSSVHLRAVFNFQLIGVIRFGSSGPFLLVLTASLRKGLKIRSKPKNICREVSFEASSLKLEKKLVLMILLSAYFFYFGSSAPKLLVLSEISHFQKLPFRTFSKVFSAQDTLFSLKILR